MNEYLTREVWKMRKNIKTKAGTPVVSLVRVENKTYQLLFLSCGCENACTFCNYGFDYNLTVEMVKPEHGDSLYYNHREETAGYKKNSRRKTRNKV